MTSAVAEEATVPGKKTLAAKAFTNEPVGTEDMNKILEAGFSAVDGAPDYPWHFVALTNQDIMNEISSDSRFGQMPNGKKPEGMNFPDAAKLPENFTMPEGANKEGEKDSDDSSIKRPKSAQGAFSRMTLGDSPAAIIIYAKLDYDSADVGFDCETACQNMADAAEALGYDTKDVSSFSIQLNNEDHDSLCEQFGVDTSYSAVSVLLIGKTNSETDNTSEPSAQNNFDGKVSYVD